MNLVTCSRQTMPLDLSLTLAHSRHFSAVAWANLSMGQSSIISDELQRPSLRTQSMNFFRFFNLMPILPDSSSPSLMTSEYANIWYFNFDQTEPLQRMQKALTASQYSSLPFLFVSKIFTSLFAIWSIFIFSLSHSSFPVCL